MILKKYFYLLCFILLFTTCQQKSQLTNSFSLAGSNSLELDKVIKHYLAPKDSLKLKAALFLIENMDNKFSISMGKSRDIEYRTTLNKLVISNNKYPWYPKLSEIPLFLDSINQKFAGNSLVAIEDVKNIRSELLIKNIDLAFEQWNSTPWKDKYTTNDFFQWVLPYRISYEPLEDWRRAAVEMAKKIPFVSNPSQKVGILYDRAALEYNIGMSKCLLPPSFIDIKNIKYVECQQYANFCTLLFRANGIPTAVDCVPVWANRSGSHYWNVTILPHGENETNEKGFSNKVSKIYRRSYAVQRNEILYQYKDTEMIPPFFSKYDMIDVTAKYHIPTSTVVVNNLKKSDSKLVWLSTFNNFNWIPVAYTGRSWGKAIFNNVARGCYPEEKNNKHIASGRGIVFLPSYYIESGIIPASSPLILTNEGTIKTLEIDTLKKKTLLLSRKYPKQKEFDNLEQNMIGGYFEGSNSADFKLVDTLLIIKRKQKCPMELFEFPSSKSYRYIRFVKKNPDLSIAEICFFSNALKLKGSPISGKKIKDPNHSIKDLFDERLDTFLPIKDSSTVWVGLDFGKSIKVTGISFSSRTDENEIILGDTYQLSYWDQQWISMESQIAEDYVLRWDNLPSNTLYLLRNLSHGVEQRIFTYEKGEQVWW